MKQKLQIVNFYRFKELLEEFVPNGFSADGCRECNENCNELTPNDDKDYDKTLKELYVRLIK